MPRKKMSAEDWKLNIERQSEKCRTFAGTVCVNVSGGDGSALVWFRCIEMYGVDRVIPVFADTNSEHEDLYRFLEDCEVAFGQELVRLNDGRNIWDVFDQTGVMRIARAGGACKASIELKQKPLADFFKQCGADAIAVGIEFSEPERMQSFETKLAPTEVLFPLAVKPRLSECDIHEEIRKLGLKPCVVYEEGQPHNNCRKYGCILAGVSQWADDVKLNPEGFDYAKDREAKFFDKTGFTVCRDQSGGEVKPYPLRKLKEDVLGGKTFRYDWRSQCSCMTPQPKEVQDECFGETE